ncbi:twin-arginine translocation signal domain-containing protein [Microlunatus elymi]|uniref:Twin-arginine translocation signal domain-containing protein n=1 Tax=Microlunatus elymi TaxID=2596828 RepID=A0A516Q1T7_9ACTN|nr:twin-arginine translocation signal domain-containing protein [Microlunatus elymi]
MPSPASRRTFLTTVLGAGGAVAAAGWSGD